MAYTWQAEDSIEPISSSTIEAIANIGTYSVATGCTISYGSGTMICTVAAGNVVFSSVLQTVAGNTVTLVADASNPRWTWIAIDSSGVAVMVAGTAAASPSVPELGNYVGIALVKVEAAQTSATAIVYKLDKRVLSPASQRVTTTTGDVVYASAAFTPARLGIGSAGQVLTVSGGLPAWAAVSAEAVDYQSFTASGTWTKPSGATALSWTYVRLWGAGGSGGGGQGSGAGTRRVPGGAAGAGAFHDSWFHTSTLAATETVTIGAGGTPGGTSGSTSSGGVGNVGGTTAFGLWLASYGGGGGAGGVSGAFNAAGGGGGGGLGAGASASAATPGAGGKPYGGTSSSTVADVYGLSGTGAYGDNCASTSYNGYQGGGGGGGGLDASPANPGGSSGNGGGGGGGGGGINASNSAQTAGAGGASNSGTSGGGGAAGAGSSGAAGTAGATGVGTNYGGKGGGGGAPHTAGTAGVGGAGGAAGGGGGGGGAGTSVGGAGGVGGAGYCQVITIL